MFSWAEDGFYTRTQCRDIHFECSRSSRWPPDSLYPSANEPFYTFARLYNREHSRHSFPSNQPCQHPVLSPFGSETRRSSTTRFKKEFLPLEDATPSQAKTGLLHSIGEPYVPHLLPTVTSVRARRTTYTHASFPIVSFPSSYSLMTLPYRSSDGGVTTNKP